MMVYRQPRRRTYQLDVANREGVVLKGASTGTEDADVAADVEAHVKRWRRTRQWEVLDAIVAKRVTLADAYDADVRGQLAQLLAARAVLDLAPLVTQWAASAKPVYVTAVRRMIPEGQPFPVTRFTAPAILAWLLQLPADRARKPGHPNEGKLVSGATRNRYKAAISDLAKWLVLQGHLTHNPTREITRFKEAGPRKGYPTMAQAERIVAALETPEQRACAALMVNGAEWGAVKRAHARDVDLKATPLVTFDCFPGYDNVEGKTQYRSRTIEITEPWTERYLRAWTATLLPATPFTTLTERQMIRAWARACVAVQVTPSRLHDLRHTYIRTAKDRGDDPDRIRLQVGHAPQSPLMHTRYGVRRYDRTQAPAPAAPGAKAPRRKAR